MKKILILAFCLFAGTANAAIITQQQSFDFSSDSLENGQRNTVTSGFSFTASSFDSTLGTLNSFSVVWDLSFQGNGFGKSQGGGFGMEAGGSLFIGDIAYSGMGDGAGNSVNPGEKLSLSFDLDNEQVFNVVDAGESYDPAILATIAGSSPFNLSFNAPFTVSPSDMENMFAGVTGTARIVYDYTATATATVPTPSTLAIFALGLLGLVTRQYKK